jgi:transposase-like protein
MSQDITPGTVVPLPVDFREVIRGRIRETIETVLEEELSLALSAARSERTESRSGYRNGSIVREVVTEYGARKVRVPRGRVQRGDGSTEWRSSILPRYQRRTKRVDEAILNCYFGGTNSRRIRKALSPLLGDLHLSKSSISRLVVKLKGHFDSWRSRDLSNEQYVHVYFDATNLPIRLARRVVKVPVLVALGVRPDGEKSLVALEVARSESGAAWSSVLRSLSNRGLVPPALVIVDGHVGLRNAVAESWPATKIQRCTLHKWTNLKSKAPKHAHGELKRDYDAIVYADDLKSAIAARAAFIRKWTALSKEVVRSLEEPGDDLLTFFEFPKSQWKCLRTTNPIEGINSAFKRRTKTQGAFTNEDAALVLLYGLFATGQINPRKIDGWKDLPDLETLRLKDVA